MFLTLPVDGLARSPLPSSVCLYNPDNKAVFNRTLVLGFRLVHDRIASLPVSSVVIIGAHVCWIQLNLNTQASLVPCLLKFKSHKDNFYMSVGHFDPPKLSILLSISIPHHLFHLVSHPVFAFCICVKCLGTPLPQLVIQ